MNKISPYKLNLFIKGGRKAHIEAVTTDLWLFLNCQIIRFTSGQISFSKFKSDILAKAFFLEPIFCTPNPIARLKDEKTVRRSISLLSKNVELTRMIKHWKPNDKKSSIEVRRLTKAINDGTDAFLKSQSFKSQDGKCYELGSLAERQKIKLAERFAITKAMEKDAK